MRMSSRQTRLLLRLWIVAQLALVGIAFLDPRLAATFARLSVGVIFALGSLFVLILALRGHLAMPLAA